MVLTLLDTLPEPTWPVALQQHPVFEAAVRRLGVAVGVVGWTDARGPGSALVLRRRFGPLTVDLASRAHLTPEVATELAVAAGRRTGLLALTPEAPIAPRGFLAVVTPAHVAEWDLTGGAAAREAALSGAWRTALRKARKAGLEVSNGAPTLRDLGSILERDRLHQRQSGFRALPGRVVLALHDVRPEAVRLYRAEGRGARLAEALILLHKPAATYHIGWSSAPGRRAQAMNLLLWQAAADLAGEGYERFDLGLVATDRAPGLARFKIGTGARVRPLGPTLLSGPLTAPLSRWSACAAA